MSNFVDTITNPNAGVAAGIGATASPMLGIDLPFVINLATAIYLGLLIVHKGWQMYKDWKKKDAPE